MKTTEAIGYIDKIICDQERYEEWALEEKSEDEELLHEIECELEALKMAKRALEEKPRWIPCSERLPEMHTEEFEDDRLCVSDVVLVSDAGRVHTGCCVRFCKRKHWWETEDGLAYKNVTAWMPLPETYKED